MSKATDKISAFKALGEMETPITDLQGAAQALVIIGISADQESGDGPAIRFVGRAVERIADELGRSWGKAIKAASPGRRPRLTIVPPANDNGGDDAA